MRILGHGIDLVEVARIARLHADHGQQFLDRCFTPAEQAYCLDHRHAAQHLAGRFAAKEAIVKVFGTGLRGQMAWTDMEILNDHLGRPHLTLTGATAALAAQQGITDWHLSISHTENHAIASALGCGP
jgi:holo-[acyl-carrier protein] synthase